MRFELFREGGVTMKMPIITEVSMEEIKLYFSPGDYRPRKEDVAKVTNALVFSGNCSGASLRRLSKGEIKIYLNPAIHDAYDAKVVVEKITKVIEA